MAKEIARLQVSMHIMCMECTHMHASKSANDHGVEHHEVLHATKGLLGPATLVACLGCHKEKVPPRISESWTCKCTYRMAMEGNTFTSNHMDVKVCTTVC